MKPVALVLLATMLLPAATPALTLEWEQTTAAFSHRRVLVTLDTGAKIEGHWLGTTMDSFTIDVQLSRGRNPPPLGVQTFPRTSITRLRFQEKRIRGRVWGTTVGYVGGAVLAAKSGSTEKGILILAATLITSFTLGLLADKKAREVRIQPATQRRPAP